MNKKTVRIISGTATIGIMLIIFLLSSQDAEKSTQTSGFVMRILTLILTAFKQDSANTALLDTLHAVIRKLAHFSEYAALGISAGIFVSTFELKKPIKFAIPWVICILYSITDEFHQTFINGRSGELRDVIIDSSGALTGLLIFFATSMIITHIRRKKTVD